MFYHGVNAFLPRFPECNNGPQAGIPQEGNSVLRYHEYHEGIEDDSVTPHFPQLGIEDPFGSSEDPIAICHL